MGFYPADILLPQGCDLKKWAVVACDQYTSQPEYWQRVERCVGTAPSALHLILPESSLDGPNVETDIMDVTNTMSRYLRDGIFRTCPSALVYVERTLASGKVRRGLVGMVDLEEYDYEPGSTSLADPAAFNARYGTEGLPVMLFAMGDGNHSLATAKACYERQKTLTPPEQWAALPARYALVELVNLHDGSLEFEPIHRVLFGVEPKALLADLVAAYPGAREGMGEGHVLRYVHADGTGAVTVPHPSAQLPVATLQTFLDRWLGAHAGRIDYIHGADVVRSLASQPGNLGFLLPPMGKEALFPTVIHDGVLPRKTFSMGEAQDKRFYLEARRIR